MNIKTTKKNLIVRIYFKDGTSYLFGNSYKSWATQVNEFIFSHRASNKLLSTPTHTTIADEPWIAWGGLKWTPEADFQHQLNREGCQQEEADNPNPRQYKDMLFYRDVTIEKKVHQLFNSGQQSRK